MSETSELQRLIVFSDLDGTLLDHEDYSWDAARPALELLKSLKIPVILASSKTAAEMTQLRGDLGLAHCEAIVENGAGILPAGKRAVGNVSEHDRLLYALKSIPKKLADDFTGFSNWTVEEISKQTGLSLSQAALAGQREFSEPGIWHGTDQAKQDFCSHLKNLGVIAQQGGRFLSLSFGGNKQIRMKEIIADYEKIMPRISIALGDAPNDKSMLENADYGIIIRNPSHGGIETLNGEATGKVKRSSLSGPTGWNEMILELVEQFKGKNG